MAASNGGGRELTRSQEREIVGLKFEPSWSLDVRVSVGGAPESGLGLPQSVSRAHGGQQKVERREGTNEEQ